MSKPCEYVITGAEMKCSFGSKKSKITGTHPTDLMAQGQNVCNINDTIIGENFEINPFGECAFIKNNFVLNLLFKGKCTPILLEYIDTENGVELVAGDPLFKRTKCQCNWGGEIEFINSGQKTLLPGDNTGDANSIATFLSLVEKIEADNPTWSKEDTANALRGLAGYDDSKWHGLLAVGAAPTIGVNDPHTAIGRATSLTLWDYNDLENMLSANRDGAQVGVVIDRQGNEISMGHVITGIIAGANRNEDYDFNTGLDGSVGKHVDNLYAATVTGDLGQSATLNWEGNQEGYVGEDTEATRAELLGDIDGLLIGEAISNPQYQTQEKLLNHWNNDIPLSEFLRNYYDNHAGHRINNMLALDNQDYINSQTKDFALNYQYRNDGILSGAGSLLWPGSPKSESDRAAEAFAEFLEDELDAEEAILAIDPSNGKVTDGTC